MFPIFTINRIVVIVVVLLLLFVAIVRFVLLILVVDHIAGVVQHRLRNDAGPQEVADLIVRGQDLQEKNLQNYPTTITTTTEYKDNER